MGGSAALRYAGGAMTRSRGRSRRWMLAATLGLLGLATPAAASEVRFPLTLDYELLRTALRKHLREQSGGQLELWRTQDGCGTFTIREPTIEPAEGRLKLSGPGTAEAGFPLFGYCWATVAWNGHAEIVARPEIGRDWQLRLRDLDTQLYDANRQQRGIATRIFTVVKGWAESQLASFTFDLGPPVEEVKGLLGQVTGTARGGALATALQTLRPTGVAVEPDGVKVGVALDLPPAAAAPRAPEPALTPAQLKRWEAALESWDGFVVFVVKDLGLASPEPGGRDELLDVLLTARHDLVAVLGRGPEPGTDPVRQLFLTTWERLRGIVRRNASRPGDETRALRFAVFLAAGDALAALEAAAPSAGLEISADGLRRLARMLDPEYAGDPLEYSEIPDAKLQQLFRFRDPDAPPRRSRRKPTGSWHWLGPRAAYADEAGDEWSRLGRRLDRWVPGDGELDAYRDTVGRLLTLAAERSIDPDALEERFDALFQHLVQAVAWQESCWRQFVRKGERVTYINSPTGDVGIMQINVRIWRGFFNPEKLRWNAAYNAGAGAEILQHLLVRYGSREAGERLENAARATYSAYNGGPARYRRYRLTQVPAFVRAIDRGFWQKYQLVAAGDAGERVLCLGPRAGGS